jgi:cardiolipin synthase
MTVPNLITAIRIILGPIFIIYLINDHYLSALFVFAVCGVSDGVDGLVARIFNQKSTLGAYLDPIADKLILVSAFVVLSFKGLIPSWLTVTVISRDVMISLGVVVLFMNRKEVSINPSIISKLNTCFQFVTVIGVLAKDLLSILPQVYSYLFMLTGILTISSGLHYMHYWFRMMGDSADKNP